MTDKELKEVFSKVRDGDKDAFSVIYSELKKPIFTIAYRITSSKTSAEDVTHDVFVKLFVSPPSPSVKNTRAWIFSVARNLSIDAIRKKKTADIEDAELVSYDDTGDIVSKIAVADAVSKLPQDEREIISLYIDCGLSFGETAKAVGLSLPAVYRKYRKALNTVQKLLNGEIL